MTIFCIGRGMSSSKKTFVDFLFSLCSDVREERFPAEELVLDLLELERECFNSLVLILVISLELFNPLFKELVFFHQRINPFSRYGIQMLQIVETCQSLFDFFCGERTHSFYSSTPLLTGDGLVVRGVDTYIDEISEQCIIVLRWRSSSYPSSSTLAVRFS